MTLSSGKFAISAGARGRHGFKKITCCSLIVSLLIVTSSTTLASAAQTNQINASTISTSIPTTATPPISTSAITSISPNSNQTTTTTAAATSATTLTTAPTTPATPITTTSQIPVAETSTVREPTEQEINEARKIIQEVASTIHVTNPHRLTMNKPLPSSLLADYAPDSPEARVSDATTQFGLNLMKATLINSNGATTGVADQGQLKSSVVSPLSLQILLNTILLGAKDQSESQAELAKVLGYEESGAAGGLSLVKPSKDGDDMNKTSVRLARPHKALHSVVDSIMIATHLSVNDRHLQQLLNTNPQTIPAGPESAQSQQQQPPGHLEAHLQTTVRDNDTPLTGQVNFTLANLMLTNKDLIQTSQEYESDLKQYYNMKVEQFSRLDAPQKSTPAGQQLKLHDRVNNWVKNITHGQIVDLADEQSLSDPNLLIVLLNAAHFKGRWLHTFNSRMTQEQLFYNNGQTSSGVGTKFMRQNGMFGYADFSTTAHGEQQHVSYHDEDASETASLAADDGTIKPVKSDAPNIELSKEESRRLELTAKLNCSALSLPFSLNDGQEISMVILLPNKRDGLDELITNLNAPALNEIYRSLSDHQVQVEVPKFTIEAKHDVNAVLEKLGVKRIFDESAELDRMFAPGNKRSAKVDKIVHKAKITVDEQGAEAAAASMATVALRSSIRPITPTFTADHPFLYVIRYNRSNMPLFMGQVRSF